MFSRVLKFPMPKRFWGACEWMFGLFIIARGGVRLPVGARPLEPLRFDSKGNHEEALAMLKSAFDRRLA